MRARGSRETDRSTDKTGGQILKKITALHNDKQQLIFGLREIKGNGVDYGKWENLRTCEGGTSPDSS